MKEQEVIKRLNFHKEYARLSSNRVVISETDLETVLNMLKEKDSKIEYLEEKRNNQKQELEILNEKQREMNKLINTVSSYKGMVKKLEKENKTLKRDFKIVNQECSRLERKEAKKEKQTDLMAEYISKIDIEEDICIKNKTNPDWCNEDYTNCKDCIKQYFKELAERKNE